MFLSPHSEPDQSSPCPHIPIHEDPSYYYPPMCAWVFQVVSFPLFSPPKLCIKLGCLPYTLHALPITRFLIRSHGQNCVRRTDHKTLYVVFSIPLLPRPSKGQIFSSATYYKKILNLRSFLNVSDQVLLPYKTTGEILFQYILIFVLLNSKLENKRFSTEW
jgi:hypothetical protein